MKTFIVSTIIILVTLVLAFAETLLFNWPFIQDHYTRQILATILILVTLYTGFRLLQEANRN